MSSLFSFAISVVGWLLYILTKFSYYDFNERQEDLVMAGRPYQRSLITLGVILTLEYQRKGKDIVELEVSQLV